MGGHVVSVVGDTDVNTTATNLKVAWEASTDPYFTAVTATVSTDTITLTADTAGVPYVVASSVTGGAGTIGAVSTTTASSGPNDWSTAANWSGGAVPVASDDVIIADNSINIAWGLAQSAVDLNTLRIRQTYTGLIGLDYRVFAQSSDGETTTDPNEVEYRETYLAIESDRVDIGEHFGVPIADGSQRICLDLNVHQPIVVIHNSATTPKEKGRSAIRLLANNSSATIFIKNAPGGVGLASDKPGETTTIDKFTVGDAAGSSPIHLSDGVTVATIVQGSGKMFLQAAATITAVTVDGGTLQSDGDYIISTGNITGGTWVANHIKTSGVAFTTLNMDGGTVDATQSTETRTWTTVNANKNSTLKADSSVLTITTLNEEAAGPYVLTVT